MNINRTSSLSFKSSIPVYFYAKNPANDQYVPVLKNTNIRKCQNFIVRNLNGNARKKTDFGLINFYSKYDKDYASNPVVHSVYQSRGPMLYMVTGNDVEVVNELARTVGIAKGESKDAFGHSKSFEAQYAAKNYKIKVNNFIKNVCRPVKSGIGGEKLALHLFFTPKYKKKSGELIGFSFATAQFRNQNNNELVDVYTPQS